MGAMVAMNENLEEGEAYYGRSSTLSFMKELRGTVPSQPEHESPQRLQTLDTEGSGGVNDGGPRKTSYDHLLRVERGRVSFDEFVLPPRSMADHLIQAYWEHVSSLYPFLYKPLFDAAYELLWVPVTNEETLSRSSDAGIGNSVNAGPRSRLFHCALNAMFALGAQFSDIPEADRRSTSNSFSSRSLALLQVDLMESGCIALVQTILLIVQYLQSTTYPNRCWNLIGMACRVSQGLGLHVEDRQTRRVGLELEMRRRVWYGCLILDM
jgi:hypothetical protein